MAYGRPEVASDFHEDAPPHGLFNCCCCLSLSLLLFLLLLIGIALFFVLVLKPSRPGFELQSAALQSFHVDHGSSSGGGDGEGGGEGGEGGDGAGGGGLGVFLSMSVALVFSASNPNKVSIVYSPTVLGCSFQGELLGVARVPSFTQPAHSRTVLTALISVRRLSVPPSASLDLLNDALMHDRVALRISGPLQACVKLFGLDSPKVKVMLSPKVKVMLLPKVKLCFCPRSR
jgi:hypothetical protein